MTDKDIEPLALFIRHHLAWTMIEMKHFRSLARALIPYVNTIVAENAT